MKKRLFAALLCALLLLALMPGAVWSAPDTDEPDTGGEGGQVTDPEPPDDPEPSDDPEPTEEPGPHVHADHLHYVAEKASTCIEAGHPAYYACDCGEWFYDAAALQPIADHGSILLPLGEHTPEVYLGTPATCAEEGVTAGFRCAVCGEVLMGVETIPKKPHAMAEAWSSDAYGHWHVCTVCGEVEDWAEHVSGGAATATTPEVCTVCGYQIAPARGTQGQGTVRPTERPSPSPTPTPEPTPTPAPGALLVSRISFLDTGETRMEDLVLEQPDGGTDLCAAQLPTEKPVSAGWYFEGWRCSADGRLYQPGDELSFRYADTPRMEMTAEWTVLIGRGNYDLSAGMRYRFGDGTFQIDGDSTVYYGGSLFYVREGGNFTIR